MATGSMIRLLVVDDDALVRDALRRIVARADGVEVVAEAADGVSGVATATRVRPHVALVDVRMPRLDGIVTTRRLVALRHDPPVRVLLLTAFDVDAHVLDGVRAGASGFLLKDAGPDEILRGIRAVAAGDAALAPSATRTVLDALVAPGAPRTSLPPLTRREREILVLLAEGYSNSEIADELTVGYETVKSHVSRLLHKLGARDRVQAVAAAHRAGVTGL